MNEDKLYVIKGQMPNFLKGESPVVRFCYELNSSTVFVEDPDGYNLRRVSKKMLTPISKSEAKKKGLLLNRKEIDKMWESAARNARW